MNKIFEIKCATIELLSDDVILIQYLEDYAVEIDDVKELDVKLSNYLKGKKIYTITDFSNQFNSFSKEAQQFLAKEGKVIALLLASAVVINNLPTRLLARFFMRFHKPNYPVKIFANISNAKDWIAELKQQDQKIAS